MAYRCAYNGCGYKGRTARALAIHVSHTGHLPAASESIPCPSLHFNQSRDGRLATNQHGESTLHNASDSRADDSPGVENNEPSPRRRRLDAREEGEERSAGGEDDVPEGVRRQVEIEPVIGPLLARHSTLNMQPANEQLWDAPRTPDLSAEEASLAAILQKLSTADQDRLLKVIPTVAAQLRWKNSKEYLHHVDEKSSQVNQCLLELCKGAIASLHSLSFPFRACWSEAEGLASCICASSNQLALRLATDPVKALQERLWAHVRWFLRLM